MKKKKLKLSVLVITVLVIVVIVNLGKNILGDSSLNRDLINLDNFKHNELVAIIDDTKLYNYTEEYFGDYYETYNFQLEENDYSLRLFYDVYETNIDDFTLSINKDEFIDNKDNIIDTLNSFNDYFGISDELIVDRIIDIYNSDDEIFELGNEYVIYDNVKHNIMIFCYDLNEHIQIDYRFKEEMIELSDTSVLLINNDNPLSNTYEPSLSLFNGFMVNDTIVSILDVMFEDAINEGIDLSITSAYRSVSDQQIIFDSNMNRYMSEGFSYEEAVLKTNEYVNNPGASEHHTGLAIDFASGVGRSSWIWLDNNAYKYGFIKRYEDDKVAVTGVNYEAWHYYYVGESIAKYIYFNRLSLEEFEQVTLK